MKHLSISGAFSLLALVSMTACVDNKYDLSDIDATSEIKVKDLTIPINLDVVKLGDIISLKEGSELTEVTINNQKVYAVNKSGEFRSVPIEVPSFTAPAPQVSLEPLRFSSPTRATRAEETFSFSLNNNPSSDLQFKADDIDAAIVSVDAIKTEPVAVKISFDASAFSDIASLKIKNVKVNLPECLDIVVPEGSSLSLAEGGLEITSLPFDSRGKAETSFSVVGIKKTEPSAIQISGSQLTVDEEISLSGGEIEVTLLNPATAVVVANEIEVGIEFKFSDLIATAFSGEINYDVTGIHIPSVELSDIPDFLAGDKTNLVLANPQIYLSLNNPVGSYGLGYESGLNIIPVRNGVADGTLKLDNDAVFRIAGTPDITNLYMSPKVVENIKDVPDDFQMPSPVHYDFSQLSYAVAGEGFPESLEIELVNPRIPTQHVEDFLLGTSLPAVEGKWEFLAPLALKAGESQIIYTDRDTGWIGDNDEDIKVTQLSISMTVDSTLPLDAELSGYPLDKDGNRVSGVEIKPVTIHANASDQEVVLSMTGTINSLDGIEYTAIVKPSSDKELSPQQTLTLKKIRAKVSGSYTTKF